MDITKTVTHVGLCAGYGGIEIGLRRVLPNLRSVALCEIEAFAVANLVAKMEAGLMDPAPVWSDLKTFPWGAFRDRVDILTGGYPCQPFSTAGKRAGKDDPRHLWPYIADGIRLIQPRLCFFENVEGHISLGLSDVIEDLAGLGYRATWGIFSAAEVGAPHQRKRVFILAHRNNSGLEGWDSEILRECSSQLPVSKGCSCWPSRPGERQHGWEPPRVVGGGDPRRKLDDTGSQRHGTHHPVPAGWESPVNAGDMEDSQRGGGKDAEPQHTGVPTEPSGCHAKTISTIRQAEPPLGGGAHGTSGRLDHAELYVSCDNRTDELRLLGNGVVPATAEKAFRVLWSELFLNPVKHPTSLAT